MSITKHITSPRLAISLAAALLQGLLLLWLHTRIQDQVWPATDSPWLAALYVVGILVPITLHLLSEHWRSSMLWRVLAAMAALLFYFGWHFGAQISNPLLERPVEGEAGFVFSASLVFVWLLFLPFLRRRLATGRWRGEYAQLFELAWQNKLALAESALFTGVLWLLLHLWAVLFGMLGYDFFKEFFQWPGFVYPFTAVAFGVALYLVGSVERVVTVAREQLLGLLKWLTPVAALILALFAPTLLIKLPHLVFSGEHAISAVWLLWLIALTVLLLNAGYQNGLGERPYPAPLAMALRFVVPAMLVVAGTALYAIFLRVLEYGITVERVFAVVVALTALAYSIGYTLAALQGGPWLRGIERINVGVAIGLLIVVASLLTPIASPYRLAAASQAHRALAAANNFAVRDSALRYLRFDAGHYGMRQLHRLADLHGSTADQKMAEHAARVLKLEYRGASDGAENDAALAQVQVFPSGRVLDQALLHAMRAQLKSFAPAPNRDPESAHDLALFVELNGDTSEECVLLHDSSIFVFTRRGPGWVNAASGYLSKEKYGELSAALARGDYVAVESPWRDLRIGNRVLKIRASADRP